MMLDHEFRVASSLCPRPVLTDSVRRRDHNRPDLCLTERHPDPCWFVDQCVEHSRAADVELLCFDPPLSSNTADIDHGDVTSPNPDDIDPYAWARAVPKVSPIIHIKQSLMDKGGHRPFTAEHNAKGRITPAPLLAALAEGGAVDNEICLELSFKERAPDARAVVADIAESIAYWAPHIDSGSASLD